MIDFEAHPTIDGQVSVCIKGNEFPGRKMTFVCPFDRFMEGLRAYKEGKLIQDAFPFLSADEREFLMTGLLPDEWEQLFG